MRAFVVAKREGNSSVRPGPDLWFSRKRGKPLRNAATSGFICCGSVVDDQWCSVDRKVNRGILEI